MLKGFFTYPQRRKGDWNTCGQAAVASIFDLHG